MTSGIAFAANESTYEPVTIQIPVQAAAGRAIHIDRLTEPYENRTITAGEGVQIVLTFTEPESCRYQIRIEDDQFPVYDLDVVVLAEGNKLNPYIALTNTADNLKYESIDWNPNNPQEDPVQPPNRGPDSPETESTPASQDTAKQDGIAPQTGDETTVLLWGILLVFAIAAVLIICTVLKKEFCITQQIGKNNCHH